MKSWSLNSKIYFLLSIFIVACIVISFMGLMKMTEIKDGMTDLMNGPMAQRMHSNKLNASFNFQQVAVRNIILATSVKDKESRKKSYDEGHENFISQIEAALKVADEDGKRKLVEFSKHYKNWYEKNDPIVKLGMEGKIPEAVAGLEDNKSLRTLMGEIIDQEMLRSIQLADGFMLQADSDYKSARTVMLLMSVLSILMGLVLAYFILSNLSSRINKIISELADNTEQVTSASQIIASSSVELSEASTQQAAALEQTAASIQEMSSMVQKNADNAKRTSELALSSNDNALRGKGVVTNMIKAIDDISDSNTNIMNQVNVSNQQISDIVKVIAEIGNKTKVINDIVFQTKLLSFNASVEAARAGEHGKGFAVVAEEVGNLAQMSGNAAQEISSMLEGSILKVEGIVNQTKEKVGDLIQIGKHKVEDGSRIARDCGHVLDEIVHNFSSVSNMASEITTACIEQSQGVQEITKAMNQLDQATQNNAINSQETASSAEKLSSQAESLTTTVTLLRKTIKGYNSSERIVDNAVARKSPHKNEKTAKIYPLRKTSSPKVSATSVSLKKAVGGLDRMTPDENDSRFEDT